MFQTLLVHLQERRYISCISQLVYADMSGLDVVIVLPTSTPRPDVSAYTNCDIQLI